MRTPMMRAAVRAGTDTVATILERGGDPNLISRGGETALTRAIWANDLETTELLVERTNTQLQKTMEMLAECSMDISPKVESFVEKCKKDNSVRIAGLKAAVKFAKIKLFKLLVEGEEIENVTGSLLDELLLEAVKSDNCENFNNVVNMCIKRNHHMSEDLKEKAKKRIIRGIVKYIEPELQKKMKIHQEMANI